MDADTCYEPDFWDDVLMVLLHGMSLCRRDRRPPTETCADVHAVTVFAGRGWSVGLWEAGACVDFDFKALGARLGPIDPDWSRDRDAQRYIEGYNAARRGESWHDLCAEVRDAE